MVGGHKSNQMMPEGHNRDSYLNSGGAGSLGDCVEAFEPGEYLSDTRTGTWQRNAQERDGCSLVTLSQRSQNIESDRMDSRGKWPFE